MTFSFQHVVEVLEKVDNTIELLIREDRRVDIRNERYFHHMFSSYLASSSTVEDTWHTLAIYPEHPTKKKLSRDNIRLNDVEYTRNNAIGHGKDGNLDFCMPSTSSISVEWKGPKSCSEKDLAEVFIKLLCEPASTPKIFAAIFLTKKGNREHVPKLKEKIRRSLSFACKVHDIQDLTDRNLYAFVRCRYNTGSKEIIWGAITNIEHPFA